MRGGSFSAAAFAFLVAGAVWAIASPWWTLREMRAAAAARDPAALAAHVDFPALRESLKSELAAAMLAEAAAQPDGAAALGAALGVAMIDPLVDGLVSPAGLRMMFAAEPARGGAAPLGGFGAEGELAIDRDGFSTFRVARRDAPAEAALVFRRDGYAWKLAGVELPEAGLELAAR
ncbi:DUF2939 domain-containing protein [Amaricoccus sp.]|uniref:DUF2939 domain-containing protein n=1 Tax=Amaricoccus sp. TaxID=1872485 RepID=UPI001B42B41D|nr:DUF2939 domain-containing protein [Amaricoccus sp.]MBP7000689.1 DUF2939 domain-containing protein [Amaricoccus sp.]